MRKTLLAIVAVMALSGPAWAACYTYRCLEQDNRALGNELDCEDAHIDTWYCMDRYDQDVETNHRLRDLENRDD